jgi:chemotaxis protein CheD
MVDIFLMPGEYYVGGAECRIRTLLGSCVSITLWHPRRLVGAMCHFLLSEHEKGKVAELSGRYGDDAMELMLADLRKRHIKTSECQAKIFGGGVMFPQVESGDLTGIGRRNGEAAERLLKQHRIPIVSESLFGVGHRHIIFEVSTGDVWVKQGELPGTVREQP